MRRWGWALVFGMMLGACGGTLHTVAALEDDIDRRGLECLDDSPGRSYFEATVRNNRVVLIEHSGLSRDEVACMASSFAQIRMHAFLGLGVRFRLRTRRHEPDITATFIRAHEDPLRACHPCLPLRLIVTPRAERYEVALEHEGSEPNLTRQEGECVLAVFEGVPPAESIGRAVHIVVEPAETCGP